MEAARPALIAGIAICGLAAVVLNAVADWNAVVWAAYDCVEDEDPMEGTEAWA